VATVALDVACPTRHRVPGDHHPGTGPTRAHVDRWLAQLFDPEHIEDTLADVLDGAAADPGVDQRAEAARRRIAADDVKIERHRAALEAGADPKLVTQWLAEAQGERLAAETELAALDQPKQVTASDLAQLIDDIHQDWGDIATALGAAQPEDKAALLTALGVSVSYDPVARTARVTCTPSRA
jgi:site-specific DNA recombinase